jgi:Helix-hairpin-helix domain
MAPDHTWDAHPPSRVGPAFERSLTDQPVCRPVAELDLAHESPGSVHLRPPGRLRARLLIGQKLQKSTDAGISGAKGRADHGDGRMGQRPNHGQQFKARFLRTSAPTSTEGIEKYLSSGMIRGIGPVYARKLVRAFCEKVFDVIEAEPDRLREVDGIGPVRAKRIVAAWAEQKVVREIMVFLHSHGVGTARAVRIFMKSEINKLRFRHQDRPFLGEICEAGCREALVFAACDQDCGTLLFECARSNQACRGSEISVDRYRGTARKAPRRDFG